LIIAPLFRPGIEAIEFTQRYRSGYHHEGGLLRVVRRQIAAFAIGVVFLGINGCRKHYPLAKLAVRVVDGNNRPLRGAAADLYRLTPSGKVYWRASRTDSAGVAVFGAKDGGVIKGNYQIHMSFITWHDLAPGETNDRPVTLKEGDDTTLTFKAVARLPIRH
jgi:hypothetical protein